MHRTTIAASFVIGLSAWIGLSAPAGAETIVHTTEFNVNYTGIRIGRATLKIEFDETDYQLDISGTTAGIARLFSHGEGRLVSNGQLEGVDVVSNSLSLEFSEGDETATLEMSFADGTIENVSLTPEQSPKSGDGWVPVLEEHLRAVIDPASSIVVPVEAAQIRDPRAVCDRTLNVYDGQTRFDIVLSYKSTRQISTDGFKGTSYVCKLKYVPVAGHRIGHRGVEYMAGNDAMEIWLARIPKTRVFTPIRIDVDSQIGQFVAYPKYFGVSVSN